MLRKKNGLSYRHQSWQRFSPQQTFSIPIDPEVRRGRLVLALEWVRAGVDLHVSVSGCDRSCKCMDQIGNWRRKSSIKKAMLLQSEV